MDGNQGQFNTFQLQQNESQPGPTVELRTPFDKSSKKPRPPPKFLASSAIAKVNLKLNSVENTLKTYMPYVSRLINQDLTRHHRVGVLGTKSNPVDSKFNDSDENRSKTDLSVALRLSKSKEPNVPKQYIDFIDYRQILIPHYFAVDEYCKYPRLIELPEFFDCFKNSSPPDYLTSAIIADSSLTSPHKELHLKNIKFFEYHYRLSLIQMTPHLSRPSLPLIQALLVLWESDQYIGRFMRACDRMTSAIRLAQTLHFHEINDPSSILFRRYSDIQINTIRRIWNVMCFTDTKIAQVLNGPSLLPTYKHQSGPSIIKSRAYYDQKILVQSISRLPPYYHTFLIQCPKLAFILTGITKVIFENSPPKSISEVEKILQPLDRWYHKLPNSIKYHPTCLSIKNRLNDPINTMRIIAYLVMLNGKLLILRHMLSYGNIEPENLNEIFSYIESLMKTCDQQLKLLQDWYKLISEEVDSSQGKEFDEISFDGSISPPFPIEYVYEQGLCYLQILKTLKKIERQRLSNRKFKLIWKSVEHDYKNLFELVEHFMPGWEGSAPVLSNFECWYKKIDTDIPLPKPMLLLDMDRFVHS